MVQTIPAPLAGKVAIITGASRGIGKAIALDFARKGCSHIAITYRTNYTAAQNVLSELRAINAEIVCTAIQAEVADPNCGNHVVEVAVRDLSVKHLDIIVSNAAVTDTDSHIPATQITIEKFHEQMTGNTWTSFSLAMASIPHMREGGRIIFMSSGVSKMGYGDPMVLIGAAKAALDSIARNLAVAYGREKGITVNSIGVGATDTDALRHAMAEWGEEYTQMAKNVSPLKRLGTPEEVASVVSFVASPEASWINGNQIPANGGALSVLQG